MYSHVMRKLSDILSVLLAAMFVINCGKSSQVMSDNGEGPRSLELVTEDWGRVNDIDWRREIVYFVMIDRFSNGDPSNDASGNPESHILYSLESTNQDALKTYQGGDFQGLLEKLPYIKSLGVTTIWLSPVYDNADTSFFGEFPYHGYNAIDFYNVENHFGTLSQLQQVTNKAHELGLKVVLDMVNNHTGREHPFVTDQSLWRDQQFNKWFHFHDTNGGYTSIKNWLDQNEVETKELYGLPDLKQENPNVYNYLLDVSKYWISQLNLDGFRLDTVRHINRSFWQRYNADIKEFAGSQFLLLGEVFNDDRYYLSTYKRLGFDSLFDFPLKNSLVSVFAKGAPMSELTFGLEDTFDLFNENELPALFFDNHDLMRFTSLAQDLSGSYWDSTRPLKMALAFIHTVNGLPFITYGTEVALPGGDENQPGLNRRMMDFVAAKEQAKPSGLIDYLTKVTQLRQSNPALYMGRLKELYKDKDTYVFAKITMEQIAIVAFNRLSDIRKINLKLEDGFLVSGGEASFKSKLVGKLSGSELSINGDTLQFRLSSKGADIFILPNRFHYQIEDQRNFQVAESQFVPGKDSTEVEVVPIDDKTVNKTTKIKKTFKFKPPFSEFKYVLISGSFENNEWVTSLNHKNFKNALMTLNEESGFYEITLDLTRNRDYEYKFLVLDNNGNTAKDPATGQDAWFNDPENPRKQTGGYGNSLIKVN